MSAVLDKTSRTSRAQEVRAADPVHDEYIDWDNDSLLDTSKIPAREGYVQRWVRTSVKGEEDQSNVFKKMNKGWRPRLLDTVPQGQFCVRIDFQGSDVVGLRGMILMERPIALHKKEKAAVEDATRLQMGSVKNNMYQVHDPASGITRPEFNERTQVSTGRPAIVDD